MLGYLLRNIDPDLWRAVKARARREGRILRFVILALLREYVQHGLRGRQDSE